MQEKQSKKCDVKNQHYVPQFYLKNFSTDKKNIGAFVIENYKYVTSASIKHQSSEDYSYSENPDIERDLGALERDAKIVIDTISGNPKVKLNSKNAYTLYLFTMIQQGRTLANANFVQNQINATTREILKIIYIFIKRHFYTDILLVKLILSNYPYQAGIHRYS